ncbi:hypothetical protein C8N32_104188 [Rhodovulum imhoffii]|uniref:Lipoprotein n=1 Tax=Rhodovulum imhoffii TaxID=365340 RepID=A0A2T5BUD4_9RHOB|nr:hypothetical protein [Rhodovulum imhoffii]MBK5934506.1 hypothetical protein [Rhodovulum imhoffii]PTN03077.1 hypothetical protein C8N32_104188 [Rhodovulum imhoffii]
MRLILFLVLPFLVACGAEPVWAPDEAVKVARYRHDGPPEITLYTMISNRTGGGGHSALMVSASERVVFDPAGTWYHRNAPERNDVHHGMKPIFVKFYEDYHARETFHVVKQTRRVTPQVAERALALVRGYGAVPKMMCAQSTSAILRQLPGFESIPVTWYPERVMQAYGQLPGVETVEIFDDDPDDNATKLVRQHKDQTR